MTRCDLSRSGVAIQLSLYARGIMRPPPGSAFAEHASEDRIDVLEMISEVELLRYLGVGEILFHLSVFFQERLEVAFAAPHWHRVALHEFVGVLTAAAFLRERNQEPLRMNEAAETVH